MLVNQPPKWTLNGVISVGAFATLCGGGSTHLHSNPNGVISQNLTLNGGIRQKPTLNVALTNMLYK